MSALRWLRRKLLLERRPDCPCRWCRQKFPRDPSQTSTEVDALPDASRSLPTAQAGES